MQKVLRKRVLRDLKENLFRYIALAFLIIIGMYVVVSPVSYTHLTLPTILSV